MNVTLAIFLSSSALFARPIAEWPFDKLRVEKLRPTFHVPRSDENEKPGETPVNKKPNEVPRGIKDMGSGLP